MKIKYSIIIALLVSCLNIRAQYDAMFTQFMFNETFINPGYTGSSGGLSLTLLNRQQWIGFPGRPVTTSVAMHAPFYKTKMGLGISYMNEKIGVLNRNVFYFNYSFRLKFRNNGILALGLMGGIHTQTNRYTNLKNLTNTTDAGFRNDMISVITPNFGSGLYYSNKRFYAGLSIPRMIDDNVYFDGNGNLNKIIKYDLSKFHYYFVTGAIFKISPSLIIKPQLFVKAVQSAPIQIDPNINFLLFEKLWLGASYRSYSDACFILGYQFDNSATFSLSYDYSLTKIQKHTKGSFEAVINFNLTQKSKKIVTPRYF
jgi:type IX secretion system PorP/SprF family membrane protein